MDGAPTEEPRPDANNARSQRPAPEGNWRVSCSCLLCWGTRGFPQMFQHVPRSSILRGCINFPCRQVNAVWGRYPTACTMYVKKKVGVCWGLVDKISPAFELRNSGVPAVVRSSQLSCTPQRGPKFDRGGVWPPDGARLAIRRQLSRQSPVAFFACTSWAVSSLYLPRTASSPVAYLRV